MLSLTCPHCQAQLTLAARRLLVRIDPGSATAGELLFTCLACHDTVALELDVSGVAAALAAGVTHLSLADILPDAVTDPVSRDSDEG